jgi:D-lactate dehydrogenase (cytochrome)
LTQYYLWLREQPNSAEAISSLSGVFAQEPQKLETSLGKLARYEQFSWTKTEGMTPLAAVYPETHEDVAATLKVCNDNRVPVFPCGAGTGLRGDTQLTKPGIVIDFSRMKGIEVAAEDSMCTVQSGVTWEELNQVLAEHGQWLPHSAGPSATLGGMAATNAVGLYSSKYGAFKTAVIGVKAVLANGSSLKSRGIAPKTYPGLNLNEILLGSEGTLGVITELTLKTYPLPEVRATGVLQASSPVQALQVARTALSQTPFAAVDVLDAQAAATLHTVNDVIPPTSCVLFKLHGKQNEIDQQKAALRDKVSGQVVWHSSEASAQIDDLQRLLTVHLRTQHRYFPRVADMVVPSSKLEALYTRALSDVSEEGLHCASTVQATTGVVQLLCWEDPQDSARQNKLERILSKVMSKAVLDGGNSTGTLSIGTDLTYFLAVDVGANSVQTQQKLKDVFDPRRILSPGKVLEDLRPRSFREFVVTKLRRLRTR